MGIIPAAGECKLFGVGIGRWTRRTFVETLCSNACAGSPLLATYLNAHTVNLLHKDSRYADALRRADILYADGMSVVWASRWISPPGLPERVSAADFFPSFCRECARRELHPFLLGSRPGVARRCAERMRARISGLEFAGTSDGFWGRGGEHESEARVIEAIKQAQPDLLLIGLGSPQQELWAVSRAADLGVPVLWCVGALFEYFSGSRRRAPRWVRQSGFEWAFRLALEPRRLGHRYLAGNFEFCMRAWRQRRKRRPSR